MDVGVAKTGHKEDVETLTTQWQQAEATDRRIEEFVEWLEADLPGRFEQLVNFIEERRANG